MRGAAALLCVLSVAIATAATHTSAPTPAPCTCTARALSCVGRLLRALPPTACDGATELHLSRNHFSAFPDRLHAFQAIHLDGNRLERLPAPAQLGSHLKELVLDDNRIGHSSDELRSFSALKKLWVHTNRLTDLLFLPSACALYTFDASHNAITTLAGPLRNCSELAFLGLSNNQIMSIPDGLFSEMSKLVYLHLDRNNITSIPDDTFSTSQNLRELYLSKNRIQNLSSGSFQGLTNLHILDLSYNEIHLLHPQVFSPTTRLVTLNLNKNKLGDLPQNLFRGAHSIKEISLRDNALRELPPLEGCCEALQLLDLVGNEVSTAAASALQGLLRGSLRTKLGRRPLRVLGLASLLAADGVTTSVSTTSGCRVLQRGEATLELCVAQ